MNNQNNYLYAIAFGSNLGTRMDHINNSIAQIESRLGKDNWKFIESSQEKRGIFLTTTAKYIITIDSTLGYECLSRGQRVGFLR